MRTRILLSTLAVAVLAFVPSQATEPDLEVVAASVVDQTVVVLVYNDDTEAGTARVAVSVELEDGSSEVLMSSNVTVDGQSTVAVTLVAAARIVGIGDGPEPIQPAP
jgi:hypothetical protein